MYRVSLHWQKLKRLNWIAPEGGTRHSDLARATAGRRKDLLGRHPAINTLPYNALNEGSSERIYLNSEGALRQAQRTQATVYLMARAEEKAVENQGVVVRFGLHWKP